MEVEPPLWRFLTGPDLNGVFRFFFRFDLRFGLPLSLRRSAQTNKQNEARNPAKQRSGRAVKTSIVEVEPPFRGGKHPERKNKPPEWRSNLPFDGF